MATIYSLADEYGVPSYEIAALAELRHIPYNHELTEQAEADIRDLLDNTDNDGVYRNP